MDDNNGKENVPLGVLGAVIGSLAGVLAIILLDRLGFVASVSGVIMAYCTIWMYQKLAKGLSKTGIIICIAVMVAATLLAENIAASISVVSALADYGMHVEFGDVFFNFRELIAEGVIDGGAYAGSLLLTYAFTALGAFGILKTSFTQHKKANKR